MYAKSFLALDGNGRLTGPVPHRLRLTTATPATFAAVHSDTTRNTTLNGPSLNTQTKG